MGIKKRKISSEMKQSYLEYAMSVIVARALPDVRDGLKPVQRRILNTMYEDGLRHNAKFRKSATVVGGTLGKYHPHGDSAVYEALARMAQDFSLRYPLVQGQGNWGSIDGDPPAAQRYTECRLSKFGEELLKDIEKETVDYSPNYDATREEPVVLPSPLPNLLLNGAMGIAVGLSTNIPPHNLTETCDALLHLLKNPEASVADLFKFIKGPDFPTGGEVYDVKAMMKAYEDGKGPILTRGKAEIVEKKKALYQIVIKEIPYGLQKSNLLRNMANLAKEKTEGIRTIRDESDKEGLRVVIELKKDAQPTKILNQLYKYTELEKVFYLNMVGLEKGIQPKTFSLKQGLENFLNHRREVVKRRTEYDLRKTEERIHILYGLKKALANIDEVIDIIKKSKDRKTAAKNLISRFKFSEKQAEVILNTKLESLVALEKDRILKELEEKKQKAKELREILEKPGGIETVIKEELEDIKKRFGDKRRTKVVPQKVKDFSEDDLIPEEENILIITEGGYIKRVPTSSFRTQKRGGKGVSGLSLKEEDKVAHFLYISSHDEVLFFTNQGKVFKVKAFEIPEISRSGFGKGIVNFIELAPQEKVTALVNFSKKDNNNFLIMGTKNGMVKKTDISKFRAVRKNGLRAMGLKENDELCFVNESSGKDEILFASKRGNVIRFPEKDIREMGRGAKGVKGMKLKGTKKKEDRIVGMGIVSTLDKQQDSYLLTLSEKGYSKRTNISKFKLQKRGGRGIIGMKLVESRTGNLSIAFLVKEEKELMVISEKGQTIRTKIKDIPVLGRSTQGVRVIKIKNKDDKIVSAVAV